MGNTFLLKYSSVYCLEESCNFFRQTCVYSLSSCVPRFFQLPFKKLLTYWKNIGNGVSERFSFSSSSPANLLKNWCGMWMSNFHSPRSIPYLRKVSRSLPKDKGRFVGLLMRG